MNGISGNGELTAILGKRALTATFALSDKGLARASEVNPAFSRKTNKQLVYMAMDAWQAALAAAYKRVINKEP